MNRKIAIIAGILVLVCMGIITYFKYRYYTDQPCIYALAYTIALVGYGICLAISERKK